MFDRAWNFSKNQSINEFVFYELHSDGVTIRASNDIRVYVVRLVLGSIPGCELYERYTFAKYE